MSFVLLLAIGAVIATAFYFAYAGSASDMSSALQQQRDSSINRLSGSVVFFAPQSMKNNSGYYGAVYNSGVIPLRSPDLKFSSSGSEIGVALIDASGTNVTYLAEGDVAFFTLSDRPQANDLLMFHSDELNHFHAFPADVSRVVLLQSSTSSLNAVDGVYENITDVNCTANSTYSWYVGVNRSELEHIFVDGYAKSRLGASYMTVTDEASMNVTDSFTTTWARVTYDISDATYAGDTLSLCVNMPKGQEVYLDYLRVVVLY